MLIACAVLLVFTAAPSTAHADRRIKKLSRTLEKDSVTKSRIAAAVALGRLADRRGVPALTRALRDKSSIVRGVAASALGHIGDRRAIPALQKATSDKSKSVRRRVLKALKVLQKKDARRAPKALASTNLRSTGESGTPRYYVVLKSMSNHGNAGAEHLTSLFGTMVRRELGESASVTLDPDKGKRLTRYLLDGAIKKVSRQQRGPWVETSCEVHLTVSSTKGRILSIARGAATVQTPRGSYRSSMHRKLQVEALDNAIKGAYQNLSRFLSR